MITLKEFRSMLKLNPNSKMTWVLPDGSPVPAHYHITEVGHVLKNFMDCGGTVRSTASCVLQVWVANDTDHRLDTTKLSKVVDVASAILYDSLPVEVEYDNGVMSQYPLTGWEIAHREGLMFYLGSKHTACLAPDKCGVGGCC